MKSSPLLAATRESWRAATKTQLSQKQKQKQTKRKTHIQGFPGGTVVKNLPANAGDTG